MEQSQIRNLSPVAPADRIETLDVLRGFALLGILLMNIEGFVGPLVGALTGLDPLLTGADRWVDAAIYVMVQGKFYTLFSLLFGMGFAVMSQRAEVAMRPFAGVYWRRGLVLLGIGLVHALLIWAGDILVTYALMSFLLLAFRPAPKKWLPWLAAGIYLLPVAFMGAIGALGTLMQFEPTAAAEWNKSMAELASQMGTLQESERSAYGAGTFQQATAQRFEDTGFMLSNLPMMGFSVFGMFLLGSWFVKSGAIARPDQHAGLFRRLRWLALPVGLAAMLGSYTLEPTMDFATFTITTAIAFALGAVGSALMCLGYMAWIVRGLLSPSWERLLRWFAPAGRMALTNYLLQSVVCSWIFYGYGLGYFERLPRAWQVPFVVALFVVQVLLSHAWLKRYRFGPMEWLWRSLTYLKPQPMRVTR
ncbi:MULTISPECIES: DUF418 domain-containing protein [unclassified Pseudoxanthomonas]|uniref:DUF418 domain-containing protein n=1 Tax=unclassified Pseudoxanthomonas TaxID=2645906 RepID=UPI003076A8B0